MTEYAKVRPDGLVVHERADLDSREVDILTKGDRVEIINRRKPGRVELAEVIVRKTKTGHGVGESGWVRADLLDVEKYEVPLPPDVPICEDAPETEPLPLGAYIVYGMIAVGVIAVIAWVINNI